MNPIPVALPSYYRHTKFRSRLEARWAYYFDLIKLPWEYEPEGYRLPSGNYCPDFKCHDFFVEVKPTDEAVKTYRQILGELAAHTRCHVFCVVGPPSLKSQWTSESCLAVFCYYAFGWKEWHEPMWCEDDMDEDYHHPYSAPPWVIASSLRFENGVAKPIVFPA